MFLQKSDKRLITIIFKHGGQKHEKHFRSNTIDFSLYFIVKPARSRILNLKHLLYKNEQQQIHIIS